MLSRSALGIDTYERVDVLMRRSIFHVYISFVCSSNIYEASTVCQALSWELGNENT